MNCQLLEPINLGTEELPDWEYSQLNCDSLETYPATSTYFLVEHPTNTEANFLIRKEFTYGDIALVFSLGLIAFWVISYILKRLFTHNEVKIIGTTSTERKF